jgi:signal transduction histidine kinase
MTIICKSGWIVRKALEGFPTTLYRHIKIEQDNINVLFPEALDRFPSVFRQNNFITLGNQHRAKCGQQLPHHHQRAIFLLSSLSDSFQAERQLPCQILSLKRGLVQYGRLNKDPGWAGACCVITERPAVVNCLTSNMKLSLRFRLAVMVLTIVALAAIMLGAANVTWRQVTELRRHFSSVRIESFHIAEHLQISVLILSATLLRFVLGRNPTDWHNFAAWAAMVVYSEMIAPLQLKLVENRATIEHQEKLASLGVLAAGVAHEIRNTLTAIKARLFILKKALGESLSPVDDADVIEREICRLERIVRDVLSFARPGEPQLEIVSAMDLLRDVRDLMWAQLDKADIELAVENSSDAMIRVGRDQLKQVLLNLIRNSADSITSQGKIALRVYKQRVSVLEMSATPPSLNQRTTVRAFHLTCRNACLIRFTPLSLPALVLDYPSRHESSNSTVEPSAIKPRWGGARLSAS